MPSKINNLPSNISRRIGICSTLIDDIMRIQVEGFEETVRLGKRIPSTTEEAQFNTAWPLAVLLLDGEVGPKQMLETRLKDERVLSLINKIELIESNELSILNRLLWKGDQRGKHASRVKIILLDGREFDSGIVSTPMEYGQNWNEEKVGRKFQWLTGNILVEKVMKQIIDMIWNFEKVNNVSKLTCLLQ